jgi:hypothetical protein
MGQIKNSESLNIIHTRDKLKSIPKKSDQYEKAEDLTRYANQLNNISKKMSQNQFNDISFLMIGFKDYLYNIIDEFSILFSKKKYKIYSKFLKNKKYNKWWIPMIDHLRVMVYIFTKKDRLLYTGILFVILSILLFFITITK